MYEIGVLSHYSSMEKDFMHMQGWENCHLTFRMGVLDLAVNVARELIEKEKVEAIIANSKTAAVIRPQLSVPVIPIYLKTFNLIRAFHLAKSVGHKMAFVEYRNECLEDLSGYDLDIVMEILDIEIGRYQFSDLAKTQETVDIMLTDGCDAVVSSASCMIGRASRAGMHTFLIKEEESDLLEALINTTNILKIKYKDAERHDWLSSVIENSDSGYIILSNTGVVNLINSKASEMLGIPLQNLEGMQFRTLARKYPVIYKLFQCTQKIALIEHNGQEILIQCVSVQSESSDFMGTLYTLNKLKNIQNIELQARKLLLRKGFVAKYQFNDIIGESTYIKALIKKAKLYAKTHSPVLIIGESGTGKELFAQSIHNYSPRSQKPFLAINCATLPPQLLESELFGYEGGAFTDAKKDGKAGLFEVANGGTVFLDEIGEMPLVLQARLLRALQEKEIRRIGGDSNIAIDVRIISATHRDLRRAVKDKKFREDLYYRINILPLNLLPLRMRQGDIPLLVDFYLDKFSAQYQRHFKILGSCIHEMQNYSWPGNVRELSAFIERLAVTTEKDRITLSEFNEAFQELTAHAEVPGDSTDEHSVVIPIGTYQQMNSDLVKAMLERFDGDKRAVEQALNISSTTLWRRLKGD